MCLTATRSPSVLPRVTGSGWKRPMSASHIGVCRSILPTHTAGKSFAARAFLPSGTGSPGLDAVKIEPDPVTTAPAISHFGHGILTFHVNCLFRTEPGFDLMAQGP